MKFFVKIRDVNFSYSKYKIRSGEELNHSLIRKNIRFFVKNFRIKFFLYAIFAKTLFQITKISSKFSRFTAFKKRDNTYSLIRLFIASFSKNHYFHYVFFSLRFFEPKKESRCREAPSQFEL